MNNVIEVETILTAIASEELQKIVEEELLKEDPKDNNTMAKLLEENNESSK